MSGAEQRTPGRWVVRITLERAYEQVTPMGTFVVSYLEGEADFAPTMESLASSDLPIDRDFVAKLVEVHGIDATQPGGPPPEVIGDWVDPEVTDRRRGLAFLAPLIPGRTDAGRAFARASQSPFDVWFKQQLPTIFPPEVDLAQPLPPIEQVWDWQRTGVTA